MVVRSQIFFCTTKVSCGTRGDWWIHHVHHMEIAANKPVKEKGMHHRYYEEMFAEGKVRGLKFSNFFILGGYGVTISCPFSP